MGSWKNDEVFKRFIGTWEVDPGTETEKERENLEKYLEAIGMYIALPHLSSCGRRTHISESIFPST
jgi:hypothetical protein